MDRIGILQNYNELYLCELCISLLTAIDHMYTYIYTHTFLYRDVVHAYLLKIIYICTICAHSDHLFKFPR